MKYLLLLSSLICTDIYCMAISYPTSNDYRVSIYHDRNFLGEALISRKKRENQRELQEQLHEQRMQLEQLKHQHKMQQVALKNNFKNKKRNKSIKKINNK